MSKQEHIPVLLEEVMKAFNPQAGNILLDATVGLGGHAQAYLQTDDTQVIGLDADPSALEQAQANLAAYGSRVTLVNSNFSQLKAVAHQLQEDHVDHILFDLGIGSHQLASDDRGFSFESGGELSMKYGLQQVLPPADLESLNRLEQRLQRLPDVSDVIEYLSAGELAQLIRTYGEERYAGRIAAAIKEAGEIASAKELAECIEPVVPAKYRHGRIHPATRTFQALRLAVNRELEALSVALPQAIGLLALGGILAVISFHSLEDRRVKHFLRREARDCICPPAQPVCTCQHQATVEILTKKPVPPAPPEVERNPRSRSAKLRLARRM